ncbi:hypothetical protein I317_03559 [Kwoniella heveanensis CBS 569]|uniref:Uncharacterized protein n=1 Tax=Kwoniella heveanensis BCC8398 TaxID=1296120 RepID=A0A1B9GR79_9TREE|nr:hypothetical protein I316_04653 [Kwoniella heveanensis BCC8398]OCF42575.1 hypothetical protein I317_03559 [Kwoniella heveanensis CBS 569]
MFSRQVAKSSSALARGFASSARANKKVAVLGAAEACVSWARAAGTALGIWEFRK